MDAPVTPLLKIHFAWINYLEEHRNAWRCRGARRIGCYQISTHNAAQMTSANPTSRAKR
jgi:hypothetical protein